MSTRLKVVSLNIWNGGMLFDEMLDFLKEQDADVLLLQEVFSSSDQSLERRFRAYEILVQELGYPSSVFGADFLELDHTNGRTERGNAIFSRWPLQNKTVTHFEHPYSTTYNDVPGNFENCPRDILSADVTIDNKLITFGTIHGPVYIDGDEPTKPRQLMVEAMNEVAINAELCIIAGDTNAKSTNPVWSELRGVSSVFGNTLTSTFNMRRKQNGGYATSPVDAMFVSPEFKVLSAECPDIDVSDHLPLVVTLEID